jgi:hypothetical protein
MLVVICTVFKLRVSSKKAAETLEEEKEEGGLLLRFIQNKRDE